MFYPRRRPAYRRNPEAPMSPQEKREWLLEGNEMLSKSIHSLLYSHPFFADLMTTTVNSYKASFSTTTACVRMKDGKIDLFINPKFFKRLTQAERTGVVLHEIMHLAFRHLYRAPKDFDHYVFNLAADIVCNDYVARWEMQDRPVLKGTGDNLTLPPTCFTRMSFTDIYTPEDPSSFELYAQLIRAKEQAKALGPLPPNPNRPKPDASNRDGLDIPNYGQSAVEYFRRNLKEDQKRQKEDQEKQKKKEEEEESGEGEGGDGSPEGGDGSSEENGGFGPDQSPPDHADPDDDGQVGGHSDHSHWKEDQEDGENPSEDDEESEQTNREKIEGKITNGMVSAARNALKNGQFSKIPSVFRGPLEELMGLSAPAAQDWRSILRRFLGSSSSSKLRTTRKRESHRFPGAEGTRIIRKKKVLVAVDTSGSMSVPIITRLMTEVGHIERAGAEVHVIYFHTNIYNPLASESNNKPYFVYRRGMPIPGIQYGGTDFEPIFQFAHGKDYDAVIVLTDGDAAQPETRIRSRVLWVLTEERNMNAPHLPWGQHILMPIGDLAKENPRLRVVNPFKPGRYV